MGIRGIYNEIGPGQRIALSKLAVDTCESKGRPLRLAIDISIWLFQIQAGKGGSNPALRTFYYRLLRLISLSIQPLFVFDGPNKPPLKRNKHTGPNVASIPEFLAKALLRHFGLPIHLAPGEAEAECAWLQKKGIVDAVLSEDVDTLMFGSGVTLRNWSPEGSLHTKTPSHVNLYDAEAVKAGVSGLDREGMILVAMMSGGDYLPEGIPGCGPKTACEAARAGFGAQLCSIPLGNSAEIASWKERLTTELRTNAGKAFSRKHKSLSIPEEFPRLDVLSYYTHPCVSTDEALTRFAESLDWNTDIDIDSLRQFAADAFDWTFVSGAKKFIRNLAPALLVKELVFRAESNDSDTDDTFIIAQRESKLVKHIYSTRKHVSTDNMTELRIGIIAQDIVSLDMAAEQPDPEMTSPDQAFDEEELVLATQGDDVEPSAGARRTRGGGVYDPSVMERIWVPELFIRIGVPLKIQDWDETFRNAKKYEAMKAARKQATAKSKRGGMPKGALDKFTKVVKPGTSQPSETTEKTSRQKSEHRPSQPARQAVSKPEEDQIEREEPLAQALATPAKLIIDLSSSPVASANKGAQENYRPLQTDHASAINVMKAIQTSINTETTQEIDSELPALPPSVTRRKVRNESRRCKLQPATQPSSIPVEPAYYAAERPRFFYPIGNDLDVSDRPSLSYPDENHEPSTPRGRKTRTAKSQGDGSQVIVISSSPTTPASRQRSLVDWLSPRNASRSRSPTRARTKPSEARELRDDRNTSKTPTKSPNRTLAEIGLHGLNARPLPRPASFANSQASDRPELSTVALATTRRQGQSETNGPKRKCVVNLRDSLEGSWNFAQSANQDASPGSSRKVKSKPKRDWRMSQIETLDLSQC